MTAGDRSVDDISREMEAMGVLDSTAEGSNPASGIPSSVAANFLLQKRGNLDEAGLLTRSSSAPPPLHDFLGDAAPNDPNHKEVESLLENAFENDDVASPAEGDNFFDSFYGKANSSQRRAATDAQRKINQPSYLMVTKRATEDSIIGQAPVVQAKSSGVAPGAVGDRGPPPISDLRDVGGGSTISPWSKTSLEVLEDMPSSPPSLAQFRPQGAKSTSHLPSFEVPNDDGDSKSGIWGPMPKSSSSILAPTPLSSARNRQPVQLISAPGSPLLSGSRTTTPLQSAMLSQQPVGHGPGSQHSSPLLQPQGQQQHANGSPSLQAAIISQQQMGSSSGASVQHQVQGHPQSPRLEQHQQNLSKQREAQQLAAQALQQHIGQQLQQGGPHGLAKADEHGLMQAAQSLPVDVDYSASGALLGNNFAFGGMPGVPPGIPSGNFQSNGGNNPGLGPGAGVLPGQFPMVNPSNPGHMFFPNASPLGEGASSEKLKDMNLQMQMAAFVNAQQLYAAQVAQMAAMNVAANRSGNANLGAAYQAGAGIGKPANAWEANNREVGVIGTADRRGSPPTGSAYDLNRKKYGDQGASSPGKMNRRTNRGRYRRYDDVAGYGDKKQGQAGTIGVADSGHSRSPLLEQFRATSFSVRPTGADAAAGVLPQMSLPVAREWQLAELKGHVVEFATDQHGSRFIQQKLETSSAEEVQTVLSEALEELQRLMMDVFGNYVVQKLLEYGRPTAVDSIAAELRSRMLTLSLHMYGCRVVQKALEVVASPARAELIRELDGHVLKCIHDQNGNHVIQKCVELVEPENVQFIVEEVVEHAVVLAEHSYGCRVVQRILEYGSNEQKEPIMRKIMISVRQLINDQYGNYVIQHVVEHGTEEERMVIVDIARNDIFGLSNHKFASNVVERCLQHGSPEQRKELIDLFINGDGPPNASPLSLLVRDQYGNYVVQRILDIAEPSQRQKVVEILREQVSAIKKYSYGKHIIARLEPGWPRQNSIQRRQPTNGVLSS